MEGERLGFRCAEPTDGDLELAGSRFLSLVKVAEPISCARVASTELSRLTSIVPPSSTDCVLKAGGFVRPIVKFQKKLAVAPAAFVVANPDVGGVENPNSRMWNADHHHKHQHNKSQPRSTANLSASVVWNEVDEG